MEACFLHRIRNNCDSYLTILTVFHTIPSLHFTIQTFWDIYHNSTFISRNSALCLSVLSLHLTFCIYISQFYTNILFIVAILLYISQFWVYTSQFCLFLAILHFLYCNSALFSQFWVYFSILSLSLAILHLYIAKVLFCNSEFICRNSEFIADKWVCL